MLKLKFQERATMKKILLRILGIAMLLVSALMISYPFISNYLMSLNQEGDIIAFQEEAEKLDTDEVSEMLESARKYNESLLGKIIITDPFDPTIAELVSEDYMNVLNINSSGVMGYLEIPAINVNLPIYHGTSEDSLQRGLGHLVNTSLPVGGESTHSVITGHTGTTYSRLFTDLNQLVIGDVFYAHSVGETLAYEVDEISVVEPNETDKLRISAGEDYITLVTCTPYGLNTHRLLVRGKRVPYEEAVESQEESTRVVESTWMQEYKDALFAGIIAFGSVFVVFAVIKIVFGVVKKRKKSE